MNMRNMKERKINMYCPTAGMHFPEAKENAEILAEILGEQIMLEFNDILYIARPKRFKPLDTKINVDSNGIN
jgi:hypothetical protein